MNKKYVNLLIMLVFMAITSLVYFFLIDSPKTDIQNISYAIIMCTEAMYFGIRTISKSLTLNVVTSILCITLFIFNIFFGGMFESLKTFVVINCIILLVVILFGLYDTLLKKEK